MRLSTETITCVQVRHDSRTLRACDLPSPPAAAADTARRHQTAAPRPAWLTSHYSCWTWLYLPLLGLYCTQSTGWDGSVVLRVATAYARFSRATLRVVFNVFVLFLAERWARAFLGSRRWSLVWDLRSVKAHRWNASTAVYIHVYDALWYWYIHVHVSQQNRT